MRGALEDLNTGVGGCEVGKWVSSSLMWGRKKASIHSGWMYLFKSFFSFCFRLLLLLLFLKALFSLVENLFC